MHSPLIVECTALEALVYAESSVVDEDVDGRDINSTCAVSNNTATVSSSTATIAGATSAQPTGDLFQRHGIRKIGSENVGPYTVLRLQFCGERRQSCFVACDEHEVDTHRSELPGEFGSESGRCSGDQRGVPHEPSLTSASHRAHSQFIAARRFASVPHRFGAPSHRIASHRIEHEHSGKPERSLRLPACRVTRVAPSVEA